MTGSNISKALWRASKSRKRLLRLKSYGARNWNTTENSGEILSYRKASKPRFDQDRITYARGSSSQAVGNANYPNNPYYPLPLLLPSVQAVSPAPLSILPLVSLIRSAVINSISCSPTLLPLSLKIVTALAYSKLSLLNPDRNVLLQWFLKKTFYAQFCAGENIREAQQTAKLLKDLGFKGIALAYAKEIALDENTRRKLMLYHTCPPDEVCVPNEILPWKKGTLETLTIVEPGDFVAIKFTGAGSQSLYALSRNLDPPPALAEAITEICDVAASRGIRLLFDAEQQALQPGIDFWALSYMRKYNKCMSGQALIYSTYQMYLKAAPRILAEHLSIARKERFVLGIKLVRGAYLGSDLRHLIHDTKANTDAAYDSIAESVIRRKYGQVLQPLRGEEEKPFPAVSLVLAGHNLESARKAQVIRNSQAREGEHRIDMIHAQLQGMADEVSCELVQTAMFAQNSASPVDPPQVYKYLVWGTTSECMKYLLRRAQENKDAMQRTRNGRDAMVVELLRRAKVFLGFKGQNNT